MPEDSKTKDMKLKIKSPLILADDYNTYAALIKKSFKQPEKLAGTEFVFISDFRFNKEDIGEHPILFLGTLNSEWKQAIRQSYKKKSTFVYGICDVAEDASGNPHGILKLKYQGGKGAKDKNIKTFKKVHKKYFSDVVFEQFIDENGQLDNVGKNLLQEEENMLGTANNEEYLALIKSFKSLQHHLKKLRAKPSKDLTVQVRAEITALQSSIEAWKNEDSNKSEEEQNTINKIELYLSKVAQQVKDKNKVSEAGNIQDVYVITSELISIQGDIGEIRMYNADKSGIDIRKELTDHIITKANKWEQLYGQETEATIYQNEQESIQKYKAYALNIQGQLEARDNVLDFRELRDDLEDLKKRIDDNAKASKEQIQLWLQEIYTIEQQFQHWGANNSALLANTDASSKEGKIKTLYIQYTQKGGEIETVKATLMGILKEKKGEKFNWGEEEAKIVKAATGYSVEEITQLQGLGAFDKELLQAVEDKDLKKSLEKLRKKLKKVEDTNAEEKRFLLWQIQLEVERHLAEHGSVAALETIKQEVQEKIKGLAQIESNNDIYEAFLEQHRLFQVEKEALTPLKEQLTELRAAKRAARLLNKNLEQASTQEEKDEIRASITTADNKVNQLQEAITNSNLADIFTTLSVPLDRMSEMLLSWDSKYHQSKHYDTIERGKEIHRLHKEAFVFFRNESTSYNKYFEFGEEFLEFRKKLEDKTGISLKEYSKKDIAYNTLMFYYTKIQDTSPISTKDRRLASTLNAPELIGLFNSKILKKVHHDTNVWLFEAQNFYYESTLLSNRIKRIEEYKKLLLPLMNYIPIKQKHFELKYQEKTALRLVQGIDRTDSFFEDSTERLQGANSQEEIEQAVMDMLFEVAANKEGLFYDHYIDHTILSKYTKKYNREVLHSKKMPDLGDFEQNATLYKEYYTNLLTYIREDARKMEVEKIQATLGEMEQNNLQYKKSQQQFLDVELENLSKTSNQETEKKLLDLFKAIKDQLEANSKQPEQIKTTIENKQKELNLAKIGQREDKETLETELAALKEELIAKREELIATNKQLDEFYDSLIEGFKGKANTPFWEALKALQNTLSLDAEIQALRTAAENEQEGAGMALGKSLKILDKYISGHKQTLKELIHYDSTDLDLPANQKIVKKLYGDNDHYKAILEQFMQDKTALYKELEAIVSGTTVEELAALSEEELKKAFDIVRAWDILTMPVIGPEAKAHLKTIQEQKNALAKYKFRLEQAKAGKGDGTRKQQEIHQYHQAILSIDKTLEGSVDDLVKDTTLKGKMDGLEQKFQYYLELLNTAIEQAYPSITAETFLTNMYWDNTIKRLALKIEAFKNHPSFLEENKDNWKEEKMTLLREQKEQLTPLYIDFSIEPFITNLQQLDLSAYPSIELLETYWEEEIAKKSRAAEVAALLAKKEEFQQELHDQLFMYRGVSHDDQALQREGLDSQLQDKVNLVCARAKRLLELGEQGEAKALVRNIPATFLDGEFVAAKRIFDDIDAILQGEDRAMESSAGTGQLIESSIGTIDTLLGAPQLDAFAKLTRENPEIIKEWGDYVKDGELSISFDGQNYTLEATDKASEKAKKFLKENKEKLTAQAEDKTAHAMAGTTAILSTISTGIQLGLDAKAITDGFLAMNQARKGGDILTEEKYASIVACNILSTLPSLVNKATGVYNAFDSLAKGEGLGDILSGGGGPEGKIIAASLKLVSSLFARAKTQLEAGLEANRKEYWRRTASNILDITSDVISLVDGGVNAVLDIFEANIPGLSIAADVVNIIKDIKNIVEKEAVYLEKKRTAHYMKILQQAGEQDSSDYTAALKGIRKDSKKQRQAAGVDLASGYVDVGLNGVKLTGDSLTATGVLAPVGEAIGIGVQILQALKTTGLLAHSAYLEYKKSNAHKEVKKLLIEAKAKNYDALAEIQGKSIHYAKAFLIGGVIDAAKEGGEGMVHLRSDNMSAAYIEHLGLDLDKKTAKEVIDAHVGMLDIGLMTHRFERYHNDFKNVWGEDPATKITTDLNTLMRARRMRRDFDTAVLATQVQDFLTAMRDSLKAYKEVKIYKANHEYVNFVDKKLGKKGTLTKVTEEQKLLLQAASSIIKETILPNIQEVLDELINQEEEAAFEKFQFLQQQEAKLENFLTKIPNKALLN